ncbi:hypothetical protein PF007_g10171 [Phytophthora fragariae]|uniref:Retrotransposon gag domain-containing protein n=1 Tax=Phytophthora fragariae TaxID=53985 RepID=A0A6A3SN62_9STRA|nr:hypothetical protein PF007_g10171 [Phytophthora fragariae]
MPFELSLRDGALHRYRQLPKKTKRTWSKLSEAFIKYYCSQFSQSAETRYYSAKREDKEHVCDYLNRLNGYARNAGIRFENGGRKARDHVKRFLETCGDSGLERRLAHLRIKDIHELEEMIVEMLKIEERTTTRDSMPSRPRARDQPRRREDRRYDDSRRRDDRRRDETRDATNRRDRRERDYERHRDDSRNVPRVTLAEASVADIVAELQVRDARDVPSDRMSSRQHFHGDSGSEEASDDGSGDSGHCDDDRSDGYSSEGCDHYLAAANDNERRAAAEGTYARSDNRPPRGDTAGRSNGSHDNRYQSRGNRDSNRDDRARQYGPCAACGGLYHSTHYCRKRCKLCKQVHDAGKCEVFQEIANLVRTKVVKKDLTPELKNLLFTEHLN